MWGRGGRGNYKGRRRCSPPNPMKFIMNRKLGIKIKNNHIFGIYFGDFVPFMSFFLPYVFELKYNFSS